MPRALRKYTDSNIYHIVLKSYNSQILFFDDWDRKTFLDQFKKSCNEYNTQILAYCLMSNHIHILLKFNSQEDMPKLFKSFGAAFAIRYNSHHEKSGSIFNGRYYSSPVEDDDYLFSVVRYIHLNPVKANIVNSPEKYLWSSYIEYINNNDYIVDKDFVNSLLNEWQFVQLHSPENVDIVNEFLISSSLHKPSDNEICEFIEKIKINDNLLETVKICKKAKISNRKLQEVLNISPHSIRKILNG